MVSRLGALLGLGAALLACDAVGGTVLHQRDAGRVTPADAGMPRDAGRGDAQAPMADAGPRPSDAGSQDEDAASPADAAVGGDAGPRTLGVCRIGGASDGFYENFDGSSLDASRWLVAHGPVTFAGASTAGGFARDNVQVRSGVLRLLVRGDRYEGPVRSVDASGSLLASGKRSGAAIATRDAFGSATYQVQGLLSGPAPIEVAIWFVRDDDGAGAIDLATPGLNGSQRDYGHVRMRTRDASSADAQQFALGTPLDDGASHILRFDWYTTSQKSVSFWIDDQLRNKSMRALPPSDAGRLWIVAWLPGDAPADFDTAEIRIDNAFITPFGNSGDRCTTGELQGPSLTVP